MNEKERRLKKEQMIDVITRIALGLEAKLLVLHDSYDKYRENYSPEALELYAEFGNYSDAVHRMIKSGQLGRLPSELLKKLLEYSLDVSERLSLGGKMSNNHVNYTDSYGREDAIENLGNDIYSLPSANEILTAQLCSILRSFIGAEYSHQRMPTSSKMDCSGMLVYALSKMGYEVPFDVTANKLATGKYNWVVLYDSVDNDKQGKPGMLNFYRFGSSKYVHVNYGVGIKYPETENQIMDASEGSSWQSGRNSQSKQNPKAEENAINKTWAPFSTNSKPDLQGAIDFSKLKRKEVKE